MQGLKETDLRDHVQNETHRCYDADEHESESDVGIEGGT